MQRLSRKQTVWYLLFLVIIWGVNWPLSKYALAFTPPLLFAGLRTFIGGLILILIALPHYKKLRFKENWHIYAISSVLNIILYYGLQTIGLNYLPAGLFSAIVFIQPVLVGISSWLWLGERMYVSKAIGLVLGFLGVAAISVNGASGSISLLGILLALGSAVAWASGTIYMKKTASRVDALWVSAVQITIGGIVLLVFGSSLESWSAVVWEASFVASLLFISIFAIALGWLVFFTLIGSGEAGKVGSFTFLIPLISIMISVLFFGEVVTVAMISGLVLILLSIVLVNSRPISLRSPAISRTQPKGTKGSRV